MEFKNKLPLAGRFIQNKQKYAYSIRKDVGISNYRKQDWFIDKDLLKIWSWNVNGVHSIIRKGGLKDLLDTGEL